MKPKELFTPENTMWETDVDDEGNTSKHLVYVGSLEDLAEENNNYYIDSFRISLWCLWIE